jgi:phosphatidylglycerophosphate synthase
MNWNVVLGLLLVIVGVLSLLLSFAISLRRYVQHYQSSQPEAQPPQETLLTVIAKFLNLLTALIGAPPETMCFVGGLLLIAAGVVLMVLHPIPV